MKTRILVIGSALLATTLLLWSGESYAMKMMRPEGGHVGNGGGVVVCQDPSTKAIKSVELLDYFEARVLRGIDLDLATLSGTWQERAAQLISRVGVYSPFRQTLYSKWLATFESEANFLDNVQFSTIPDTGFIAVPNGCEFAQGLVQSRPRFSGDKRYFINNEYWKAMNDSQRAGLVLHEFLYREAMGYGHTDSISVRHLNGTIADVNFKNLNADQWMDALTQGRFEMNDVDSMGAQIESRVDVKSLWAPGPDEKIERINIRNRFLIALGICDGEDCSTYHRITRQLNGSIGNSDFRIHMLTTRIDFDHYRLYTHGKTDQSQMDSGFAWESVEEPLSLFLRVGNQRILNVSVGESKTYGASLVDFNTKSTFEGDQFNFITYSVDQGPSQYSLMSASALRYTQSEQINDQTWKETSPLTIPYGLDKIKDRQCALKVVLLNSQEKIQQVQSYKSGYSVSPSCLEDSLQATLRLPVAGGMVSLKLPANVNGIVTTDQTNEQYLSGGNIDSVQFSHWQYECVFSETSSGCMSVTLDSGTGLIQKIHVEGSLIITAPSPSWGTTMSVYVFEIGTGDVEVYANGVAKSVVIKSPASIRLKDGTLVSFKAGDTVKFDQDGFVTP